MFYLGQKCYEKYDKEEDPFISKFIMQIQGKLQLSFHTFIDQEATWILKFKQGIKQNGVLDPVQRYPAFLLEIEGICARADPKILEILESICTRPVHILTEALFNWLEKSAAYDPKYTDVSLLENYHYFSTILASSNIPCLKQYVDKARSRKRKRRKKYVRWSLAYELPQVISVMDRLEENLNNHESEEVHVYIRKTEVNSVIENFLSEHTLKIKIDTIYKRLQKHIPTNNSLVGQLWKLISDFFLFKYERFVFNTSKCYNQVDFELSADEIRELFYTKHEGMLLLPESDDDAETSASSFIQSSSGNDRSSLSLKTI